LLLHGKTVRKLLPLVERLTYLSRLPKGLLRPPKRDAAELVQIQSARSGGSRSER